MEILFNPEADLGLRCAKGAEQHWRLLKDFIRTLHSMAMMILSKLSDALCLEGLARFEAFHKMNEASTSIASLQRYLATDLRQDTSMGHFAQTDASSLTIRFNSDGGLQAFSSTRKAWETIRSRQDCAIVNVGDSLRFLSLSYHDVEFSKPLGKVSPQSLSMRKLAHAYRLGAEHEKLDDFGEDSSKNHLLIS